MKLQKEEKRKPHLKEVTNDSSNWMNGYIFSKCNYLSIKDSMRIKRVIPSSLEVEFQKPHPLQAFD